MGNEKFEKLLAQLGKEKRKYADWQKEKYPVKADRPPVDLKKRS